MQADLPKSDAEDLQALLNDYSIPLETPAMDGDALQACSYILIRHGLSDINVKRLDADKQFGKGSPEAKAAKEEANRAVVDPELHKLGVL